MNSVIQCVVLLSCVAFCISASIKNCQCVKTDKAVKITHIIKVTEYKPRPYCNKHEVIVTMKNNTLRCLDPQSPFTQELLKEKSRRDAARADKRKTVRVKTTTAATTASPVTTSVLM